MDSKRFRASLCFSFFATIVNLSRSTRSHVLTQCFKNFQPYTRKEKNLVKWRHGLITNLWTEFSEMSAEFEFFSNWSSQRSKMSIWTIKSTFLQVYALFSSFLTTDSSLKSNFSPRKCVKHLILTLLWNYTQGAPDRADSSYAIQSNQLNRQTVILKTITSKIFGLFETSDLQGYLSDLFA